ncbi:MAG: Rpn family recombination-promoting nuclease/putative transposase [Lachnospiraceae bacterium]|jgi:predicted transposase/invertase (TIGR01784 family)|nr:Rpn family recombination-promoting nuclease/putative transposase [Lachnospiraceae bacterium]
MLKKQEKITTQNQYYATAEKPSTETAVVQLKYPMTDDILFKMYFVKYPKFLKRLVSIILQTPLESITEFTITNTEIPPGFMDEKFCRLDIHMIMNGQRLDLEVQVDDEKDYPERSLYYWARDYSSALPAGEKYKQLPRVIIINILAFHLFDCAEYHSEYRLLEVNRHTTLTDKQILHYYELPKLPDLTDGDDELMFWLTLFKARTENDLNRIVEMGVPIMKEAIDAYKNVSVSQELYELERLRDRTRHNEASAIAYAQEKAAAEAEAKVEELKAELANKDAEIMRLRAMLNQ